MADGDFRKQLKAGDPIPSSAAFNEYNRAARLSNPLSTMQQSPGFKGAVREGIIVIQNNSGTDRKQFEVLGISGVLFTADKNLNEFLSSASLKGVKPTQATYAGKFAICAEPIKNGKLGRAFISGRCPVRISEARRHCFARSLFPRRQRQRCHHAAGGSVRRCTGPRPQLNG